jgi:hypothetical protein
VKVDNLFCFILSLVDISQIKLLHINAIDIFEDLTMNTGAMTWVEFFWSYNVKNIDYGTIFLVDINKIINKIFIRIQSYIWCYWKVIAKFDLI